MNIAAMHKRNRLAVATVLLQLVTVVCLAAEGPGATPDLSGVWQIEKARPELRPEDGSALPLTPEGKKLYDKNQALRRKGDYSFDITADRCSSPGAVRMMALPNPVEFFQRPYQLTMLFEWNHLYRLVNLREQPRVAPYPMAIGISNGRWEGDTLVVETTNIIDNTLLDSTGLPHSDELRVTERIRLIDGDKLENVMTLHDPKTFSRDWSVTLTYRKTDAKGITEDVCLDRLDAGQPAVERVR